MASPISSTTPAEVSRFGQRSELVMAVAPVRHAGHSAGAAAGADPRSAAGTEPDVDRAAARHHLEGETAPGFLGLPIAAVVVHLLRLTLNVATTRSILLHGEAGSIVRAFGDYVVQGQLLVGLVVFAILVIIQFIVVTKGAGRISEVAARFILDAMPGKQMAIDAELNAGAIDEPVARRRREHLIREAEFHGAMDGASKFVRGDAIAGLIITGINLVGGVIMGLMRGMDIASATRVYSVLTIGDQSRFPTSRVHHRHRVRYPGDQGDVAIQSRPGNRRAIHRQFAVAGHRVGHFVRPGAHARSAQASVSRPGGGIVVADAARPPDRQCGQGPDRGGRRRHHAGNHDRNAPFRKRSSDDFLHADRVGIEIGARLIPFAKTEHGNLLVERVMSLRRDLAKKNGVWVPSIRIRDNIQLDPNAYRFFINGREVANGSIRVGAYLALASGERSSHSKARPRRSPPWSTGEMDRRKRQGPRRAGRVHRRRCDQRHDYPLQRSPAQACGRAAGPGGSQATDRQGARDVASLVDELIPNVLNMGGLHRILTLLLEEKDPLIER